MKKFISLIAKVILISLISLTTYANDKAIISNIEVIEDTSYHLKVSINYNYSGEHGDNVTMRVFPLMRGSDIVKTSFANSKLLSKDKNNATISVYRRGMQKKKELTTNVINIALYKKGQEFPFYNKTIDYLKVWETSEEKYKTPKDRQNALLSDAIAMIDDSNLGGERLQLAKKKLEKILFEDPQNVQAYLEMARVKMKEDTAIRGHKDSNGVTQAKQLIEIALDIDTEYANTYILLGYVNTLQGNLSESIENFEKAESIGTKNMWLYSNWGRSLEKANNKKAAIQKYNKAISHPLKKYRKDFSLSSGNRAISLIFEDLLKLLTELKDWDAVDTIYKEKVDVFNDACSYSQYAYFRLQRFGDYDEAIKLAEKALPKKGCRYFVRETLASSYLLKIAKSSNLSKKDSKLLYNKSFVLMSNPVALITDLARSSHTSPAIEVLSKKGIDINSKDTRKYSPLAYAIYQGDQNSVNTLISNGAKLDLLVSENKLTYLMLAVSYNREALVKLLIEKGADTKAISEDGHTALSIAKALELKNIEKILIGPRGA